jgi:hypothetical protein
MRITRYPRRARTAIRHAPHLFLDCVTFGAWIPIHILCAVLGGRKTKFK